jgi:hypothetical protein
MVDGQQRSRTIISYIDRQFVDFNNKYFEEDRDSVFLEYEFPVTTITDTEGASIEKFYAIVNRTGIHLNKPEVRKADFYDTKFLKLVSEIASSSLFKRLSIFTESSLKRMNDIEFISELVLLTKVGHVNKKENLDDYFKNDLTTTECNVLKSKMNRTLIKIISLDQIYRLSATRYRQKNDFYTLFDFILKHDPELSVMEYFYKILVLIGKDIKPTQEECPPLKEYAINCVTQSNSKLARDHRLNFFESLLLNAGKRANIVQSQILTFYQLSKTDIVSLNGFLVPDVQKISSLKPKIIFSS